MTLGKTKLEKQLLMEVRTLQKRVIFLEEWHRRLCDELPIIVRMKIQKEIDNGK